MSDGAMARLHLYMGELGREDGAATTDTYVSSADAPSPSSAQQIASQQQQQLHVDAGALGALGTHEGGHGLERHPVHLDLLVRIDAAAFANLGQGLRAQ